MSIPKRQSLVVRVGPVETHDRLPVVVAAVDASLDAERLALLNHVRDEGTVVIDVARPFVVLDVVPVHVW